MSVGFSQNSAPVVSGIESLLRAFLSRLEWISLLGDELFLCSTELLVWWHMVRRDLRHCTICTCPLVVTVAIGDTSLLGLHAENLSLFITSRTEWHHTLWMWRKFKWCNCRRKLRMNWCWSGLVQRYNLQNGGSLGAERTQKRSGIVWL